MSHRGIVLTKRSLLSRYLNRVEGPTGLALAEARAFSFPKLSLYCKPSWTGSLETATGLRIVSWFPAVAYTAGFFMHLT